MSQCTRSFQVRGYLNLGHLYCLVARAAVFRFVFLVLTRLARNTEAELRAFSKVPTVERIFPPPVEMERVLEGLMDPTFWTLEDRFGVTQIGPVTQVGGGVIQYLRDVKSSVGPVALRMQLFTTQWIDRKHPEAPVVIMHCHDALQKCHLVTNFVVREFDESGSIRVIYEEVSSSPSVAVKLGSTRIRKAHELVLAHFAERLYRNATRSKNPLFSKKDSSSPRDGVVDESFVEPYFESASTIVGMQSEESVKRVDVEMYDDEDEDLNDLLRDEEEAPPPPWPKSAPPPRRAAPPISSIPSRSPRAPPLVLQKMASGRLRMSPRRMEREDDSNDEDDDDNGDVAISMGSARKSARQPYTPRSQHRSLSKIALYESQERRLKLVPQRYINGATVMALNADTDDWEEARVLKFVDGLYEVRFGADMLQCCDEAEIRDDLNGRTSPVQFQALLDSVCSDTPPSEEFEQSGALWTISEIDDSDLNPKQLWESDELGFDNRSPRRSPRSSSRSK